MEGPRHSILSTKSNHAMSRGRDECAKDNDGFMIIYNFPNGDRIALDIENEKGTVWYLVTLKQPNFPYARPQ